ncbi:uncharacterized protein N7458_001057 [Penicillium daleae]|uniref:Dienelactone hydrolase domain-containing protein n=1 Tax=Penicillium daleae TaxID=63821 RepID=A0AAD6G5F5_9EURO|nr:uncharacterized protein N7458_001057 [Penicillium daleae]KAJ5459505.1 hypothetical protein N7458_001057 [Penicillium daleae]
MAAEVQLRMASNPPGPCCFVGFKHDGTPSGSIRNVHGGFSNLEMTVRTYVAEPKEGLRNKGAVLLLSDVFGLRQNSQLLADDFASNGYLAVLPDLLDGESLPLDVFQTGSVNIPAWALRHGVEQVDPIVDSTIKFMREEMGVEKIAAAGYCFGAKYTARFLKAKKIDVGYVAHPSYITFEELESIENPLSITAAEQRLALGKKVYQINLFSGVAHGFAVRGDLSIAANRWSKEQALLQALAWFEYHL